MNKVFTCGSPHLATDLAENGVMAIRVVPNPYHTEDGWCIWEYEINQKLLDALDEMDKNGYHLTNSARRV